MKLFTWLVVLTIFTMVGCSGSEDGLPAPFVPGDIHYQKYGKLIQVSSYDTTGGNNDRINIAAGDSAVIFKASGPGVISRIWATIDSRDPYFLRRILIKMYWDDEKEPSVVVPVGDFFGSGFKYKQNFSKYVGMSSGGYYCYFPMPFKNKARIEVINQTRQEVYAFYYHVDYYKMDKSLPDDTPYFHARWKRNIRTSSNSNYVALDTKGRGYYVGTNFSGQPYNGSLVYLEGDEMFYVDGEQTPSIHGTGMEDYFTSGWYFKNGEFSAPYHGLVLKDDSTGRVTAYRFHIPDAIPFDKSFKATFEHGHANEESADYSTTAYWYQTEPHPHFPPIIKAGLRLPLQRPVPNGAVEAETLQFIGAVDHTVVDMSEYGADWSNNKQLEINGVKGKRFALTIPDLLDEAYDADLYLTGGPGYGTLDISAKGGRNSFDGYAQRILPKKKIQLKHVQTDDDQNLTFSFTIDGKNGNSKGYKVGIDAIKLSPIRHYIPEWYLIGPFPNPRESDDLRYGLDTVYPPEKNIDLDATYRGANGKMARWTKVTGKAGYDMNLNGRYRPSNFIIAYALTYIYSPEEQIVPFLIGSDDGSKIFLNDKQVYRFLDVRIAAPDQDRVNLHLKKGWNKVLFKAENNFGGFGFYARLIDRHNNITVSADKKLK
ncbi:MAG: DUF2961 domain-containing protein [Balneolaceae bacterium]|jgi:hypothetical protein